MLQVTQLHCFFVRSFWELDLKLELLARKTEQVKLDVVRSDLDLRLMWK